MSPSAQPLSGHLPMDNGASQPLDPASIEIHSSQADYYHFRTPYVPGLFASLFRELGVSRRSVLMDLACGRGEVAAHLARRAGVVYGVDGSQEMIELAWKAPNITYQLVDLNADTPSLPGKVDHFFFGRAIHWFPAATLTRLSGALLRHGGKIVVCSSQWQPVGDWGLAYFQIKQKYSEKVHYQAPDFSGSQSLAAAGYRPLQRLVVEDRLRANIDFMIGHTFAITYRDQLLRLKANAGSFVKDMRAALQDYENRGLLVMKVSSWAIIYGCLGE